MDEFIAGAAAEAVLLSDVTAENLRETAIKMTAIS
jgi:hypothetical protein